MAAVAVILAGTLSSVPAPMALGAASTKAASGGALNRAGQASAHAVSPAPISDPAIGSGSGDPSVSLPPLPVRYTPPKARTEVPGLRGAQTRVWANPDGSFTQEASSGLLNYRDDQGAWQRIDHGLAADRSTANAFAPKGSGVTLRFSSAAGASSMAEVGTGADAVSVRVAGYGSGFLVGDRIVFDAAGRPQVFFAAADTGAEFGAVFSDRAGPASVSFIVQAPAGSAASVDADGQVVFTRGGKAVATIDAPLLFAADSGASIAGNPVTVTLDIADAATAPAATATPSPSPVVDRPSPGPSVAPAPTLPASPAPDASANASATPTAPPSAAPSDAPGSSTGVPSGGGRKAVAVTYTIDPAIMADPSINLPLTLDPVVRTVCSNTGGGSCFYNSPNQYDTYIGSGQSTGYPGSPSANRVGYDNNAVPNDTGTNWGDTRSLLYLDGASLPDGAQITAASLNLREDNNSGGVTGSVIFAALLSSAFSSTSTWSQMAAKSVAGYDSPTVAPCNPGTVNCWLSLDVTKAVRANYTKRGQDWKAAYGFMVRMTDAAETANTKEVVFYKANNATPGVRPYLSITYEVMNTGLDFDEALGPSYSPSRMTAGVPVILPVRVENKAGSSDALSACAGDADTDCYQVGYRFLDAKGAVVKLASGNSAWGFADLPGDIAHGAPESAPIALTVTPPPNPGQYTLRLDVVHRLSAADPAAGVYLFGSDWALPSMYFARNKKVLSSDVTRWVGASVVERAEFSIDVTNGDIAGDSLDIASGDGGTLSIDLANRTLDYAGDTGLGFTDLVPVDLTYTYNSADTSKCETSYQGVLGACGWSTSLDERFTGGPNSTGYDYSYQDPSGDRYMVDTDGSGQLSSAAGVLLERPRVTFADETRIANAGLAWTLTDAGSGVTPYYGAVMNRVDANLTTGIGMPGGGAAVDINVYRMVRFAMRGTSNGATPPNASALCFKIRDASDSAAHPDTWLCYTVGATWTPAGYVKIDLGQVIANAWALYSRDIRADALTKGLGGTYDSMQVVGMQILTKGGWTTGNQILLDAARFEPTASGILAGTSAPSWTANGGSASAPTGDVSPAGAGNTTWETASGLSGGPACDTTNSCWSASAGALQIQPFASWWWRAVGGSSAAVAIRLEDVSKSPTVVKYLVYYAGAVPPAGVPSGATPANTAFIQVAPVVPTVWTHLVRNVREDARSALNFYTDTATATTPAGPDDVRLRGYAFGTAGDGGRVRVADIEYSSLPDVAKYTRSGLADEFGVPASAGDTTFTYDFRATYPDGSVHYFNEQGLLERIANLDGASLNLDYAVDGYRAGQSSYILNTVRAAGDGMALASGTAVRRLAVSRGTDGYGRSTVRFDEVLGSTTSDASTRAAVFEVASTTQTGSTTAAAATQVFLGSTFTPVEGTQMIVTGAISGATTGNQLGVRCPQTGSPWVSLFYTSVGTGAGTWSFDTPLGASSTGCTVYLTGGTAGSTTLSSWTIQWVPKGADLLSVSPARAAKSAGATGAFCTGAPPDGCLDLAYTDASTTHHLSAVRDPRYTSSNGSALSITWGATPDDSGSRPTAVTDASTGAVLARIVKWNGAGAGSLYRRPLVQTAAMVAASTAAFRELSPEGSSRATYNPSACGASCASLDDSGISSRIATLDEFGGDGRTSQHIAYRCNGASTGAACAASTQVMVTRNGSNAGAKVDNYIDPLAGNAVGWTQDPDQYFASLRDSGGHNPDLYRTTTVYDGWHQPIEASTPVLNQGADYADAVAGAGALVPPDFAYWRMGAGDSQSSGGMTDALGLRPGTWQGSPQLNQTADSAIVRSGDGHANLNGSSQYGLVSAAPGNALSGSFTVEAWVRSTAQDATQAVVGTPNGAYGFNADLCNDATNCGGAQNLRVSVGNGATAWLANANFPFAWAAGRWYHVVIAVNDAADTVTAYIDGQAIGAASFTTAGTAVFASATTSIYLGQSGTAGSPEYLAGSLDEVAVYRSVLAPSVVRAHADAGRGVVITTAATVYDTAGHPRYAGVEELSNGDFEDALDGWAVTAGSAAADASVVHADTQAPAASTVSARLAASSAIAGLAHLVPGQTARVQFYAEAAAGGGITYAVEYWDTTSSVWAALPINPQAITSTSWTGHAWDVTLPADDGHGNVPTDGRVRVRFATSAGGAGWIDDVAVVTAWGRFAYTSVADGDATSGLPKEAYTLALGSTTETSPSLAEALTEYAPGAAHPGILPTKVTSNFVNGTPDASAPDEDVAASSTYDAWGHVLSRTDPDGVVLSSATYNAAGDVATSTDQNGVVTTLAYDAVGNAISAATSTGKTSATSYDRANRAVAITAPDGTVTRSVYTPAGLLAASIRNYVAPASGTVAAASGTQNLITAYGYDAMGLGRVVQTDSDAYSVDTASGAMVLSGSGVLDSRTTADYDAAGNAVAGTVYPGAAGTGTGRTTTSFFATAILAAASGALAAGTVVSATRPAGTRPAVSPDASPAPLCPGSSTVYCATAAVPVAVVTGGPQFPAVDLAGRTIFSSDAYGTVTRTLYDLAGRTVETVAALVPGADKTADTNVVASTQYTLSGLPAAATDAAGRTVTTTYDRVGRGVKVVKAGDDGSEQAEVKTVYTLAGRTARTSAPADPATADSLRTWTLTLYDAAGRAVRTVSHYDTSGAAGILMSPFEGNTDRWGVQGTGWFTNTGATMSLDTPDDAVAAMSGAGRLHVTTSASTTYTGAVMDLAGRGSLINGYSQTFKAGHTYKVRFAFRGTSGATFRGFLGNGTPGQTNYGEVDTNPNSPGVQYISGDGAWHTYTATWSTGSSDLSSSIQLAVRKDNPGTASFYLDDVVIWDTGATALDRNIPTSETAYDADGRTIASVVPPGDPATESPMVTTTSYDPMDRTATVTVNAVPAKGGSYAAAVAGEPRLTHFWRMAETSGQAPGDFIAGANTTVTGSPVQNVAGPFSNAPATSAGATTVNGAAIRVAAGAATLLSGPEVTIEAWVKPTTFTTSTPAIQSVMGSELGGGDDALLRFGDGVSTSSNKRLACIFGAGGTEHAVSATTDAAAGTWYHVACTWSASSGQQRLYINGAQVASATASGSVKATGAIGLGSNPTYSGRALTGSLAGVATYARELPAGAIAAHYRAATQASSSDANLTTATAYDALGRAAAAVKPNGIATTVTYDHAGRAAAVTANAQDGTPSSGGLWGDDDLRTTFGYDATGAMTVYCPAKAAAGTDACDPASTSQSSPAYQSAWRYAYDALGRQVLTVPPVNTLVEPLNTSETVYDAGGRVSAVCSYPAGGSCAGTASTSLASSPAATAYDRLGRRTSASTTRYDAAGGSATITTETAYLADGSPASVTTGSDESSFAYGHSGRLASVSRDTGSGAVVQSAMAWSPDGTLASRTDGSGSGALGTSSFSYDWAGRLVSAAPPSGQGGAVAQAWRLDGLLASRTLPSADPLAQVALYDAARRPAGATLVSNPATSPSTVGSLGQSRDRAGSVVSDSRSLPGSTASPGYTGTASYGYDGLGRLVSESGLGTRSYRYDLDGNRVLKTDGSVTTSYAYDRSDQLASQTVDPSGTPVTTSFAHDAFGAMASQTDGSSETTSYSYDALGRLSGIEPPSGSGDAAALSYDALGRLDARSEGAATDSYRYAGASGAVYGVEHADAGGSASRTSLVGPSGERLSWRDTATADVTWTLFGGSGGAAALLGASGTACAAVYRYDGWGQPLAGTGAGSASPFRFNGSLDVGAGGEPLYLMGARLYSPSAGVFTSVDSFAGSAADPLSLNRFLYAEASPATLVDPTGHAAVQGCASSDLCDETMAIRHGGTAAGREAARRVSRRDRGLDRDASGWKKTLAGWKAAKASGAADARESKTQASVASGFTGYGDSGGGGDPLGDFLGGFAQGAVVGAAFVVGLSAICALATAGLCLAAEFGAGALAAAGVGSAFNRHVLQGQPVTWSEAGQLAGGIVGGGAAGGLLASGDAVAADAAAADDWAAQLPMRDQTFTHFTDANGVRGITGVEAPNLGGSMNVPMLSFSRGENTFLAQSEGDIFVTDLPASATPRQLAAIGVFGPRQQYALQFSGSDAAASSVDVRGGAGQNIFTIPGGCTITGACTVTRVR